MIMRSGRIMIVQVCPTEKRRPSVGDVTEMIPPAMVAVTSWPLAAETVAGSRLAEPMNPATNTDAGAELDLLRSRDLLELALAHDGDPVSHGEAFLLIVGHEDERDPDLAPGSA